MKTKEQQDAICENPTRLSLEGALIDAEQYRPDRTTITHNTIFALQIYARAKFHFCLGQPFCLRLEFSERDGRVVCDCYNAADPGLSGLHPFHTEVIAYADRRVTGLVERAAESVSRC